MRTINWFKASHKKILSILDRGSNGWRLLNLYFLTFSGVANLPRKILIFIWCPTLNPLPMNGNLYQKGVWVLAVHPRCDSNEFKDDPHAVFGCLMAQDV